MCPSNEFVMFCLQLIGSAFANVCFEWFASVLADIFTAF